MTENVLHNAVCVVDDRTIDIHRDAMILLLNNRNWVAQWKENRT